MVYMSTLRERMERDHDKQIFHEQHTSIHIQYLRQINTNNSMQSRETTIDDNENTNNIFSVEINMRNDFTDNEMWYSQEPRNIYPEPPYPDMVQDT